MHHPVEPNALMIAEQPARVVGRNNLSRLDGVVDLRKAIAVVLRGAKQLVQIPRRADLLVGIKPEDPVARSLTDALVARLVEAIAHSRLLGQSKDNSPVREVCFDLLADRLRSIRGRRVDADDKLVYPVNEGLDALAKRMLSVLDDHAGRDGLTARVRFQLARVVDLPERQAWARLYAPDIRAERKA